MGMKSRYLCYVQAIEALHKGEAIPKKRTSVKTMLTQMKEKEHTKNKIAEDKED